MPNDEIRNPVDSKKKTERQRYLPWTLEITCSIFGLINSLAEKTVSTGSFCWVPCLYVDNMWQRLPASGNQRQNAASAFLVHENKREISMERFDQDKIFAAFSVSRAKRAVIQV